MEKHYVVVSNTLGVMEICKKDKQTFFFDLEQAKSFMLEIKEKHLNSTIILMESIGIAEVVVRTEFIVKDI